MRCCWDQAVIKICTLVTPGSHAPFNIALRNYVVSINDLLPTTIILRLPRYDFVQDIVNPLKQSL